MARAGSAVGRMAGRGRRRIHRATHAEGAGETGLAQLIELHAVQSACDAIIAVALAGTLFFGVPVGEARGRVLVYLLLTVAPFTLVAPVVGPVLDRFRHGRRYALAATLLGRGFLAWIMAGAIATSDPFTLFPAAFGVLVLSKAYGVSRSAVVPRLLPRGVGLVRANARVTLAGTIASTTAAALAAGFAWLAGSAWTLRLAAAACLVGIVFALRLPAHADAPPDTDHAARIGLLAGVRQGFAMPRARSLGTPVVLALRGAASLRMLSGFLLLWLAFLVRTHSFGVSQHLALAVLAGGTALGGFTGTTVGAKLRRYAADSIVVGALMVATAVTAVSGLLFGLATATAVAFTAGAGQTLGKLGLDAVIQRETPETIRTSVFARSETALQLAWVVGGVIGLGMPDSGLPVLLGVAVALGVVTVLGLGGLARARRRGPGGPPASRGGDATGQPIDGGGPAPEPAGARQPGPPGDGSLWSDPWWSS